MLGLQMDVLTGFIGKHGFPLPEQVAGFFFVVV
jgi:hypothetical protein